MEEKGLFKNIREYENLHIALWLLKDTCWVMSFKVGGMIMIVPTLLVAIHLTWRSRKNISDLFHNIAVCLWISANAIWMTGEFFFNDTLRPYSTVLFLIGIVVVAFYYAIHFPNRAANTVEEVSETDNQKRIEAHVVQKAA
jgi:uncharacterized membrane protein (GlpM family)